MDRRRPWSFDLAAIERRSKDSVRDDERDDSCATRPSSWPRRRGRWLLLSIGFVLLAFAGGAAAQSDDVEISDPEEEVGSGAPSADSIDDPGFGELDDEDLSVDDLEVDADTEERDWSDIEEIQVKGRAGSKIAVDAAESAVQFDSAELEALGVGDVGDIAKITPNLEIRTADATNANFFIRGVGLADFSANSASAVAVYQDGVPLNASAIQLVGLFDTASVEVLRGPQGTGSGRNATAGAIRIDSRKPTGDLQAQLRTSFGTYASDVALSDALIMDFEGALEVPLIDDLLSTRMSFRTHVADPFMVNGCGNAPPPSQRTPLTRNPGQIPPFNYDEASICGETNFSRGQISPIPVGLPSEIGDRGNWAARGVLRFQPTVLDMDWLLTLQGGQIDQQTTLGQAMGTFRTLGEATQGGSFGYTEPDQRDEFNFYWQTLQRELGLSPQEARGPAQQLLAQNLASGRPLDWAPYRGDYNRVGQTTRDAFGAVLNGTAFFDDVPLVESFELNSVSAYDEYERFRDADQDFTPQQLFERVQDDGAWQFFQELKATGESQSGTFRWELGGYYLMEELESDLVQFTSLPTFTFYQTFGQDLWSFAFYGGFGWDFLDDFTIDAGIRYNWERKDFRFSQIQLTQGATPTVAIPQSNIWSAPTGLASLKYRVNEDVAVYAKYTRGWKGGHYNANNPNTLQSPVEPVDPETLDSIEVGFRGSWLDTRLSMSGAFFYYKYEDHQLFLFEPGRASAPNLEIVNANSVEQYGIELDLTTRPIQDVAWVPEELGGLEITLRFGWLESQFLNFVDLIERTRSTPPQGNFQQVVNYTGNRLPNSPPFKLSGSIMWPFELGDLGTLIPRYDFDWTDEVYFGPNEGRGTPRLPGVQSPLPELSTGQAAFARHNVRLSYLTPDATLEISVWARNLTDERYKTFAFDASIFAAVLLNFVGDPRTVGMDLSFRF